MGRPAVEMLDREILRRERSESYKNLTRGILEGFILAAAAAVIITNFWVHVFQIDGSSMNPLLQMDEIVLVVDHDSPDKNDIIAFYYNNKLYIKRVIATGGDRVDISNDGVVSVNGNELDEPYVTELKLGHCDIEFPFSVPSGTVFVLGDNRPASMDSRDSRLEPINREQIVGKVKFRVWPLSRTGSIS